MPQGGCLFCATTCGAPIAERECHIFVGPSLPSERRGFAARYHPPISRGELEHLVDSIDPENALVVIIDGRFGTSLSLSVMECRVALERGVALVGLSSIGALRAADLWPLGMLGFGDVYFGYRAGLLLDDSDVAVVYDEDLQNELTVSGVRCRAIARSVVEKKRLPLSDAEPLVSQLLAIAWHERTDEAVAEALESVLPGQGFAALVSDSRLNPKTVDAERFLSSMTMARSWPSRI